MHCAAKIPNSQYSTTKLYIVSRNIKILIVQSKPCANIEKVKERFVLPLRSPPGRATYGTRILENVASVIDNNFFIGFNNVRFRNANIQ